MTEFPAPLVGALEPWTADAACRAHPNPDLWFPRTGRPSAEAKAFCAGCPVKVECLAMAMENQEPYGIWGGASRWHRTQVWNLAVSERRVGESWEAFLARLGDVVASIVETPWRRSAEAVA